ncbi:hypothetical protein CBS101457_003150 [Exobasidium rhododendri]|nr:hypothetical protein CBS101457_003150 [Exobasidium rhododendri]
MASASVYYRFKSQKEPSRITFDGTGISVWDLKREIILQNKMGKGLDFDLAVYSQDTEDELKDDNFIIPRSSQVIARRLPPSRPGKGSAAHYVADLQGGSSANANVTEQRPGDTRGQKGQLHRGQMSMRFDGRDSTTAGAGGSNPTGGPSASTSNLEAGGDDEASRIAAMFQATTEQWDETQEKMSHATFRERGGAPRRGGPPRPLPSTHQQTPQGAMPDRPPPIGYICFRCGTKGHWIHDCPTNNDRDFDNKPRYKRTTGIPKSMLKTIEAPTDEMKREGVMVTPDGSYVVAQVDSVSWAKNQAIRNKPLTKSDIFANVPNDPKLACSLCNKLLKEAVKTPCCSTLFCQECIVNYLLEHEFQCSECDKRVKNLETLTRDDEARKQVREYVDSEIEKSEKKIEEVEKAEKEKLETAQKEKEAKEEEEAKEKAKAEGGTALNGEGEKGVKKEVKEEGDDEQQEGDEADQQQLQQQQMQDQSQQQNGWNPQAVQQIMAMLCNPQLPPPMRLQLQMQLQFMQNQFMQNMMLQQQQQQQGAHQQQTPLQGNMPFHQQSSNPYAGQHQMGMGGFMGMGSMFNQPQATPTSVPFRPAAPLSHQESAYMRLPINANNRNRSGVKRERPTDFLELG